MSTSTRVFISTCIAVLAFYILFMFHFSPRDPGEVFDLPHPRHFRPCRSIKDKITSANLSSYDILNQPKVGEFVRIRIQAVSTTNCPQREGGDFWFAVLRALNTTGSSSSPVVDHKNGTYSVDLFVGWSGYVAVDITLVHPSVATRFLDRITNISDFSRIYWNGKFRKTVKNQKGKKVSKQLQESASLCYLMFHGPSSWENKCAYTNEKALGVDTARVCDKPGKGFSCDDLVSYSTNRNMIAKTFLTILTKSGMTWSFKRDYYLRRISNGQKSLRVQKYTYISDDPLGERKPRVTGSPSIGDNAIMCSNLGVGFWLGNEWKTSFCRTKQWNYNNMEIGECLADNNVYLLGDSTTRQWLLMLLHLFQVQFSEDETSDSYTRYFKQYNINITWQFHPHRIGSKEVKISHEKFEVDVLDGLRDPKCNYIVTISPWAHFAQWWLPAYKERVRLISEAIRRFKKHCPYSPVIVKGPHVRRNESPEELLMHSDYILFQIKTIMEEMLNITGVYYIDVWNMNLAYPSKKTIHMPPAVIKQELNLFFSYICPELS